MPVRNRIHRPRARRPPEMESSANNLRRDYYYGILIVSCVTAVSLRRICFAYNDIVLTRQEHDREAISVTEYRTQLDNIFSDVNLTIEGTKAAMRLTEKRLSYAKTLASRLGFLNRDNGMKHVLVVVYGEEEKKHFETVVQVFSAILDNKYAYVSLMLDYNPLYFMPLIKNSSKEEAMLMRAQQLRNKVLKKTHYKQALGDVKVADMLLINSFIGMVDTFCCWLEIFVGAIIVLAVWTRYKSILMKIAWFVRHLFGFVCFTVSLYVLFVWVSSFYSRLETKVNQYEQLPLLYMDLAYIVPSTFDFYSVRLVRSVSKFSAIEDCGNLMCIQSPKHPCVYLKLIYWAETICFCNCLIQMETNSFSKNLDVTRPIWSVIALGLAFAQKLLIVSWNCLMKAGFLLVSYLVRTFFTNNRLGRKWEAWQKRQEWFIAAEKGLLDTIKEMLKSKHSLINLQRQADGETCLTIACKRGRFDVVLVLINHADIERCNVNRMTKKGDCALMISAERGHVDITARLLQCPDLDLDCAIGEESIQRAIRGNFYEIALMIYKMLLNRNVEVKNTNFVHLQKAANLSKAISKKRMSQEKKNQKIKELEEYKVFLLQSEHLTSSVNQQESNSSALYDLLETAIFAMILCWIRRSLPAPTITGRAKDACLKHVVQCVKRNSSKIHHSGATQPKKWWNSSTNYMVPRKGPSKFKAVTKICL